MFNKIFIILLFCGCTLQAQQAKKLKFTITGDMSRVPGASRFYISYTNAKGKKTADSVSIVDGKFVSSGTIAEPQLASIQLEVDKNIGLKPVVGKKNFIPLFLEPANYHISSVDWLSESEITGSALQDEFKTYKQAIEKIYLQMRPHNEQKRIFERQNDLAGVNTELTILDSLRNIEERFVASYVKSHPDSPVSLAVLNDYGRTNVDIKGRPFETYFHQLNPVLRQSEMGKMLKEKIMLQTFLKAGAIAPAFSQPDTLGKMVQLKYFKGQYVFLDFWASWCGPCRAEIPFLKKAYAKFKDKSFQVVSISLDTSRERWLKAIKEDGTGIWPQLGDMIGKTTPVALEYKVSEIPQNVLIGPDGKIIAKNLYKLELENTLEKIFK